MRIGFLILLLINFFMISCQHNLTHERYIQNNSSDTVLVYDFNMQDTVYSVYPTLKLLIYHYEILDTKQEKEPCEWMGDSLLIINDEDVICLKNPRGESNWTTSVVGDKNRVQTCIMSISDNDF